MNGPGSADDKMLPISPRLGLSAESLIRKIDQFVRYEDESGLSSAASSNINQHYLTN